MSSHKSNRLAWRQFCRRRRSLINAALAAVVLAVLLATATQAALINCRPIPHGRVCWSTTHQMKMASCDLGYWLTPRLTCRGLP